MVVRRSPVGPTRIGVIQFPGSNCDADCLATLHQLGVKAAPVWHGDRSLPPVDGLVIPGGFSFGDYLRSGALAAHSPIMSDIRRFVAGGGAVIGICNGFQILVESKILPGVLLHNASRKFICRNVILRDEKTKQCLKMPMAHGEGRYWNSQEGLKALEGEGLVAYRYADERGNVDASSNPNGAVANIAGIFSSSRRVLGMMPHPERATEKLVGGSDDGLVVWREFLERL